MSGPCDASAGRAEKANHMPSLEYAAASPTTTTLLMIAMLPGATGCGDCGSSDGCELVCGGSDSLAVRTLEGVADEAGPGVAAGRTLGFGLSLGIGLGLGLELGRGEADLDDDGEGEPSDEGGPEDAGGLDTAASEALG